MKKMNRNQWIAVGSGLALVGVIFYGNTFMNLFNSKSLNTTGMDNQPQSGVQTTDVVVGTGEIASVGDQIAVHYVGTLTDGKVFDSSVDRGQPFVFTLGVGQVIKGWDEGVVGMRVGGKRKLIISPDYGYGAQDVGPIPKNSTLLFDVELLGVQKPQAQQ